MADWKTIWNRREWSGVNSVLGGLIAADGFDQGAGRIDPAAWQRYTALVADWLDVGDGDSIFDVGCGSGAFVYPFFESGHRVGGIDYSEALIAVARRTMPGMDFSAREAGQLETADAYDFVVSNGVFHYFPDTAYAEAVIRKMLTKARKAVAVLEVPNLELRNESEAARAAALPPGEYEKKYSDLPHQYYSKRWFAEVAERLGCTVRVLDQQIEDYGNNKYRFNALFQRPA